MTPRAIYRMLSITYFKKFWLAQKKERERHIATKCVDLFSKRYVDKRTLFGRPLKHTVRQWHYNIHRFFFGAATRRLHYPRIHTGARDAEEGKEGNKVVRGNRRTGEGVWHTVNHARARGLPDGENDTPSIWLSALWGRDSWRKQYRFSQQQETHLG